MSPEKAVPAVPAVSTILCRAKIQCSRVGEEWSEPAVVPREK